MGIFPFDPDDACSRCGSTPTPYAFDCHGSREHIYMLARCPCYEGSVHLAYAENAAHVACGWAFDLGVKEAELLRERQEYEWFRSGVRWHAGKDAVQDATNYVEALLNGKDPHE